MRRGEVWIRATNAEGTKWGAVDVFDLDDDSFRAWVVDKLTQIGCVVRVKVDGQQMCLRAKEGVIVD